LRYPGLVLSAEHAKAHWQKEQISERVVLGSPTLQESKQAFERTFLLFLGDVNDEGMKPISLIGGNSNREAKVARELNSCLRRAQQKALHPLLR
jgi:hypothetical protein